MSLTGRDSELEKEGDRLQSLFNYAREQAELQTRDYGVLFQDDGYEFLVYDVHRGQWRSVFEDDALPCATCRTGWTSSSPWRRARWCSSARRTPPTRPRR